MVFILGKIWGTLIIICGLFLLTKKKLMVEREYSGIFMYLLIWLAPFATLGYELQYIFIFLLPMCAIAFLVYRGRFTIYNVNIHIVSPLIIDILKSKNISYEEEKNSVILKGYDNRRINYTQSLNSVEVNFNEIRGLTICKEIKDDLRSRIRNVTTTVFPFTGIWFIATGVIILLILLYLPRWL